MISQDSVSTTVLDCSSRSDMRPSIAHCDAFPKETNNPLTVFAKHKVIPGKEHLFEEWIKEMGRIQKGQPGYKSSEVIRPCIHGENDNEFVSIFRYESYEKLQLWMQSKERDEMVEKTKVFSYQPLTYSFHSLEYWFVPDETDTTSIAAPTARRPPATWKMVLVTFVVIWSQLQFVPRVMGYIPHISNKVREALGTFVIVLLTTYVFFPILTRVLAFWLFPQEDYWQHLSCLKSILPQRSPTKQLPEDSTDDIESGEKQ